MERPKGWFVKQSFSNDFVDHLQQIYDKYGEGIFEMQGIANRSMDLVQFSKSFFSKSGNVADISIDANANVKEKNITQYNFENNKALMKLNSIYLLYKYVKKFFTEQDARTALEKVINGELFVNDLTNFSTSYCFAFDLRNLLADGMGFFKGGMTIKPPKRSDSFLALLIQSTAYISNQILGACSFPDLFVVLDWFYRKEMGEDYAESLNPKDKKWNKVKNQFQNLIYSFNFPFRGNQSSFTNLSVMDMGFMASLFKGYIFPDFSEPNLKSAMELSKRFFEYYTEINSVEGIFTFPVMTLAVSLDEKRQYIDPDFVDWAAEVNSKKALANIFQDKPTSFSSCCRLKSDYSKVADIGYQNSFGVGGLSIGSHRVAGLNLPRIALLEKDDPTILEKDLDLLHKILYSHRQLIKERIAGGYLPLYTSGWIHLQRQYSTIGFIGGYEYIRNKGHKITSKEGLKSLQRALVKIENAIVQWQTAEKAERNIYNIEQIPGESMAVRLAEMDYALGFNNDGDKKRFELYSNQYIPLIEDASIYDRIRIQGEFDSLTSGGSILHINVDDERPISKDLFRRLMVTARDLKATYFAINYAYSECEDGHMAIGRHEGCPVCRKKIVQQYTRVVGFITPVRSWNKTRRDVEYPKRHFYRNGEMDVPAKTVGEVEVVSVGHSPSTDTVGVAELVAAGR